MPNELIEPEAEQMMWDQAQLGLYKRYYEDSEYVYRTGLMVLPVAGEGEAPVVVRIHSPYRERVFEYDIHKENTPPILPSPKDSGPFRFIAGSIAMSVPMQNHSQRNFDWRAKGRYVLVDTATTGDDVHKVGLTLGMTPWVYGTQLQNADIYGGGGIGAAPGAVGEGGFDVAVGNNQAASINTNYALWVYNSPSYYPPLFNETLINGGPQAFENQELIGN